MSVRDEYSLSARIGRLFSIDLRSLAAMRCLAALTMLWCLIVWAPDLGAFFTDEGLLKRVEFAGRFDWARFSLLRLVDGWAFAALVWVIGFLSAICLLLGYRSRIAAFVCWIVYLSFVGRNPMLIQGGDILMPLLLFWMIFLPIGAVFAIDAALSPQDRRGDSDLSIATVGLLLQVLYVYVFGALLKTSDIWVPNGSAIYLALHLDTFVTPVGEILRDYVILMQLLTFFVYWLELLAPVLLFFPDKAMVVRTITLGLLWLMHLGFRIFLHIGHFWMASLSSLCAYIPAHVWRWIGARSWRAGADRVEIYYDRDCGFCLKTALILREFFLPRTVPVQPAQDVPAIGEVLEREVSWVVIDADGRQRLRWDAVVYVMTRSRLLLPFGWIASIYGATGLGDPTYKLIGDNRRGFGAFTSRLLSLIDVMPHLNLPVKGFLVCVIAFCFVWNVSQLEQTPDIISEDSAIARVGFAGGMTQRWTMFAPSPPARDGYPVLAARRSDGGVEDIFRDPPAPVSFDPPADILGLFENSRWRAFLVRAWVMDEPDRGAYFARFAKQRCADLNADRIGGDVLEHVTIHYVENETLGGFKDKTLIYEVTQTTCAPEG